MSLAADISQAFSGWAASLPPETIFLVPVLAFMESCVLVGLFVSGIFLLGTVSVIYAQGEIGLLPLVLLAFAGALAGDHVGYFVGYRGAPLLWRRRWVRKAVVKRKGAYRKTSSLIEKSAPWAVCIGRLTPAIRSLTPLLVGASGIKPRAFLTYDLLACSIWASGLALLAYGANQVSVG